MTNIDKLEARVDKLADNSRQGPALTTEEGNMVRGVWINLHFTPEEAEEYSTNHKRMEDIHDAAGSVYLNAEQNREYMKLSGRCTQLASDIVMKRVIANHAMRDRVWSDLAPRVLRLQKLQEKPREELAKAELEELESLLEWFDTLQAEALKASRQALHYRQKEQTQATGKPAT